MRAEKETPKKMGRPAGLPKTGGRTKGTPNKEKPLKAFLRAHSDAYFAPTIEEKDEATGMPTGRMISQYDIDLMLVKPSDRINAELALLKYHTPQMQATAVDVAMQDENKTLSERLSRLSNGEDIPSEEG